MMVHIRVVTREKMHLNGAFLQKGSKMDWEEVKTFALVAQAGTVRKAADALGVHHSSVSRRLARLENSLGSHLFDRTPDGLALTTAGETLKAAAAGFQHALYDVERAIAGQDQELTGTLKVTMAEPFAVHVFVPELSRFTDRYPGLNLELTVSYDLLDVARREADVAIRMDNNPPEGLIGKRFFPYTLAAYASPAYLKTHDLSAKPATARWLGWVGGAEDSTSWTLETPFPNLPVWGFFSDISVQIAAAKEGLGMGYFPCLLADCEPGLIRASNAAPVPARDIWVLTHPDLRRTARVRAFMEFAESVIRGARPRIMGEIG